MKNSITASIRLFALAPLLTCPNPTLSKSLNNVKLNDFEYIINCNDNKLNLDSIIVDNDLLDLGYGYGYIDDEYSTESPSDNILSIAKDIFGNMKTATEKETNIVDKFMLNGAKKLGVNIFEL